MRQFFLVAALLVACKSDEKSSKPAEPVARPDKPSEPAEPAKQPASEAGKPPAANVEYTSDIEKLCDSMALSGADKLDKQDRIAPHSVWLGQNIKTEEARSFMIGLQSLEGAARADALETEAKRVGLSGCAFAAEFR